MFGWQLFGASQQEKPAQPAKAPVQSTAPASAALGKSEPVRLRIPKIGVDANVIELGIQASGEIEVPKDYAETGWYKYGATPGEVGPTVIAGHLDSPTGPAVFVQLEKLQAGDRVEFTRKDGSSVAYTVSSTERYAQSQFPTEKVYGNTAQPEVRLITCDGIFDKGESRYSHNLVVSGTVAK